MSAVSAIPCAGQTLLFGIHAVEADLAPCVDSPDQVADGGFGVALASLQHLGAKLEDVGGVSDQPGAVEGFDLLRAQSLDVKGVARGDDGWTRRTGLHAWVPGSIACHRATGRRGEYR